MTQAGKTGRGRILFWRGGSLWLGWAGVSTGFHAHHAIQVGLALTGGELRFSMPGGPWLPYKAAIIASNQEHAFEAQQQLVAQVFVEPETQEGQVLRHRYASGISAANAEVDDATLAQLSAMYHGGAPDDALIAFSKRFIARLAASELAPATAMDARIEKAIALLGARLDENVSLAEIAAAVHLSPERFRHLFVEQTGIRYRPFILWMRLCAAVSAYARGAKLTDAAQVGGFADSAHFSRTFKRMFGSAPVSIEPEQPFHSSPPPR